MAIRKEELWRRYVERNPHWLTDGASLTPDGIKRLFDQTFELGHQAGFENGKAKAEMAVARNSFSELFKCSIFGR